MAPRPASSKTARPAKNAIDNYDIDDDDDPFADLAPRPEERTKQNADSNSKKRKDVTGLGINEEVSVSKKPRAPIVKLDETRLLSEKGIPRLRRKARELRFKGRGNEFSDAARLLSFYQLWLDDLFPKAKFVDALKMVEKAGHSKFMRLKRLEWIDEGKPKSSITADYEDLFGDLGNATEETREPAKFPARVAPIFQKNTTGDRAKTPTPSDPFDDDEDIYGATPQPRRTEHIGEPAGANSALQAGDEPDEDELDALMAGESMPSSKRVTSLFGNGNTVAQPEEDIDDDELDALMAESQTPLNVISRTTVAAQAQVQDEEEDDLDALMAEAEAHGANPPRPPPTAAAKSSKDHDDDEFDDDAEAAMAEMDGL